MTTVIDPSATPIPVFNRGGIAIIHVEGSYASPQEVIPIPYVCGHTIVIASILDPGGVPQPKFILPENSEIGDLVEIYGTTNSEFNASAILVAPEGERFTYDIAQSFGDGNAIMCRKISADTWGFIRSTA